MQINAINNQGFQGKVTIPASIKSKLSDDIHKVLCFDSAKISKTSALINNINRSKKNVTVAVVPKNDVYTPKTQQDFDVLIGNDISVIKLKAENLAEKFLNAIKEAQKML